MINPITVAMDIAYNESIIGEYYLAMKLQSNRQRIIGFTRILKSELFWKSKRNNRLFDWL